LSHDFVESSLYIPHDRSHMRTTKIKFEFGRRYDPKFRLTTLKSVLLTKARAKRF